MLFLDSKDGLFTAAYEHLCNTKELDDSLLLDMTIVAMWDRAATNKQVNKLAAELLKKFAATKGKKIEKIVFERMQQRAKL